MAIDKQHILDEIKRIARANNGKAPGEGKFGSETGIKKSDWCPDYWLRWSEALQEAGLTPNKLSIAYDKDVLLENYISLIQELGHFPIHQELLRKHKRDGAFPGHNAFNRLGSKSERAAAIIEYCQVRGGLNDVIDICSKVVGSNVRSAKTRGELPDKYVLGFVYLMKSGRHYKIGKTNAVGRRERDLAIQLPEKANTVHVIKTDDPTGIEVYWHRRFEAKRGNGEWFELTAEDIKAFKRRKFM